MAVSTTAMTCVFLSYRNCFWTQEVSYLTTGSNYHEIHGYSVQFVMKHAKVCKFGLEIHVKFMEGSL